MSKNQLGLRNYNPFKISPGSHSPLATLYASPVAAHFRHFHSQSASRRVYIASASQYPSQIRNCARLLIVATESSCLNCQSRLK